MPLNLDAFDGRLPYASDLFGVFQPLLGWTSRLNRNWFSRRRRLILPDYPRYLRYRENPELVFPDGPGPLFHKYFLEEFPKVSLTKDDPNRIVFEKSLLLDSLTVRLLQETFREQAVEHAPEDTAFWTGLWAAELSEDGVLKLYGKALETADHLMTSAFDSSGLPESVHDYWNALRAFFPGLNAPTTSELAAAEQDFSLLFANREYLVARHLLELAKTDPASIAGEVLRRRKLRSLVDALRATDLAALAPRFGKEAVLSPIGLIHLFRQTFFEFDSFLGEPVEHVWLSPGSTVELVETSTRRVLTERTFEQTFEELVRRETTDAVDDEIARAVKSENQRDTKLGSQLSVGVNILIIKAEASGSLEIKETEKVAREEAHKQRRQQTTKLSSEIRQSFKSAFKTVVETTDTRSRRYVIQNPGLELVNYELRRKMRHVGVQLQSIGSQLAWQIFIDEPGRELGVAELVHLASKADVSRFPDLATRSVPTALLRPVTVFVPIPGEGQSSSSAIVLGAAAVGFGVGGPAGAAIAAGATAILDELFGDDDPPDSSYEPGAPHNITQRFKVEMPEGYELMPVPAAPAADLPGKEYLDDILGVGPVRYRWTQTNGIDIATHTKTGITSPAGEFIVQINGGKVTPGELVGFDVVLHLKPTQAVVDSVASVNKGIIETNKLHAGERANLIRAELVKNVKERVKLASSIHPRRVDDLREEERTIVYRRLVARLMREAWKVSDDANDRALAHLRSELIRSIFDLDRMLYFVAPEWWLPRVHSHQQLDPGQQSDPFAKSTGTLGSATAQAVVKQNVTVSHTYAADGTAVVGENETTGWGGAGRPDNYLITEDSQPAPKGASLGWLLQLDGDSLRNAFLNAPWVKAVVPIQPGKERDALDWLMQSEIEGKDGLQTHVEGGPHDGLTFEEMLFALADAVKLRHDKSKEVKQETVEDPVSGEDLTLNYLAPERVFERGFDRLKSGFRATLDEADPFPIIDQWVEVLPTDQIVAVPVEYDPRTGRQII